MNRLALRPQLASLSDNVFGVSMTLLAADVAVPVGDAGNWYGALMAMRPQLGALALSFAIAAQYWVSHHQRLMLVERLGRKLLLGTLVFLFAIVTLPIATRLSTKLGGGAGVILYGFDLSLISTLNVVLWVAATREAGQSAQAMLRRRFAPLVAMAVFILGTAAAFVNASWGPPIWCLALVASVLERTTLREAN